MTTDQPTPEEAALAKVIASRSHEPREPFPHEYDLARRILAAGYVSPETLAAQVREARAEAEIAIRPAIAQEHVRASTDLGPDYCATCSEAIQEWVTWPCVATKSARIEARAEAWDEGHRAAGYEPGEWGDDNPYRAAAERDGRAT